MIFFNTVGETSLSVLHINRPSSHCNSSGLLQTTNQVLILILHKLATNDQINQHVLSFYLKQIDWHSCDTDFNVHMDMCLFLDFWWIGIGIVYGFAQTKMSGRKLEIIGICHREGWTLTLPHEIMFFNILTNLNYTSDELIRQIFQCN